MALFNSLGSFPPDPAGTVADSRTSRQAHTLPDLPSPYPRWETALQYHQWRSQALTLASARRELWCQHHAHSTRWLLEQLKVHQFHLSDYCRPYRSDHLRAVSRWYVRLIVTELRHRGAR